MTQEVLNIPGVPIRPKVKKQRERAPKSKASKMTKGGPLSADKRSAVISQLFEKAIDNKFGRSDSFRKVIDLIYYALTRYKPGHEDKYMEVVKQLDGERKLVDAAAEIYTHLFKALYYEQEIRDYLGDAYMYLGIGNPAAGQFMTPWPVARMMAEMCFSKEEYEKAKAEGRKLTIIEPTVGSGVMLLAWKDVIIHECGKKEDGSFDLEQGLRALEQYEFYGQDVDALMIRMCQIQLLLTDYRYMRDLLITTAYEMKELQDKLPKKPIPAIIVKEGEPQAALF